MRLLLIEGVRLIVTIQGFIGIEKANSRLAKLLKIVVVGDEKLPLIINLAEPLARLRRPERRSGTPVTLPDRCTVRISDFNESDAFFLQLAYH